MNIDGAEDVADPVLAVIRRNRSGSVRLAQPAPWIGLRLIGPT